MTIIHWIKIKNFLSIGSLTQEINLSIAGLTLVLGENFDVGGGDQDARNGVGKTSSLQAISYGLFGEPLTKIKLDNLVNNINNKGMFISIGFESNGKNYVIERGRKPNILRFFEEGVDLNEAKGENKFTQQDIERILGISHAMFKHVVAMNIYTDPFMRMKAADQREVIEELLGITLLSKRAEALKDLRDDTQDALKDEEAKIKANTEANARIEQAIERARTEAEIWQTAHDRQVSSLVARAEEMGQIDVDVEIVIFDQIDAWNASKKEYDHALELLVTEISDKGEEIVRIKKEIRRYQEEAERVDSGEVARLEAQAKRYLAESEEDATPHINRLSSEAIRRRKEAENKMATAEKLAVDMIALQEQIDNPNAHTCTTCGQGLAGTDHLTKVTNRLQKQVDDLTAQIQKAMSEADACNAEAESIDVEIEQLKERYASKKEEARSKAKAIQQDIEIAKTVLAQHREAARERITERQEVVTALQQEKDNAESSLVELREALTNLGHKPVSKYHSRDAVWKFKQERDLLLAQIETEMGKPNIHLSKIEGLQSTLIEIDYEPVNELNLRLKHEVFLYKLLTAKDSFIRKKIIDQNLSYLNNRLNHYLEKLRLPHEVRFMPDLTVEIALLGRELDFEQLSSGEKNRLILANSWAFRDVWESSNESFNLYFLDEIIDGLDGQGAESALMVLQGIARDRNKSVFLISHKDNLIGRADRVMMVRKEDQFTTIIQDYHMAA